MSYTYQYKITGRVQGVGYRYFVVDKARVLKLTGWVKNNYDGSVSVFAQGEEDSLETFLFYLKLGPTHALVSKVEVDYPEGIPDLTDFVIKY